MDVLSSYITQGVKAVRSTVLKTPEIQIKVEDACNDEKWGPSGTQMLEIAKASMSYENFPIIMETIWTRLQERDPAKWRHVYKALLLLNYLICNGSKQVVEEIRVHIMALQELQTYNCIHEGQDHGIDVRERAKQIIELIHDERRIEQERERANNARAKFGESISSDGRHVIAYGGYGNNEEGGNEYRGDDDYERGTHWRESDEGNNSEDEDPFGAFQGAKTNGRQNYDNGTSNIGRARAPSGGQGDEDFQQYNRSKNVPQQRHDNRAPQQPIQQNADLLGLSQVVEVQTTPFSYAQPTTSVNYQGTDLFDMGSEFDPRNNVAQAQQQQQLQQQQVVPGATYSPGGLQPVLAGKPGQTAGAKFEPKKDDLWARNDLISLDALNKPIMPSGSATSSSSYSPSAKTSSTMGGKAVPNYSNLRVMNPITVNQQPSPGVASARPAVAPLQPAGRGIAQPGIPMGYAQQPQQPQQPLGAPMGYGQQPFGAQPTYGQPGSAYGVPQQQGRPSQQNWGF